MAELEAVNSSNFDEKVLNSSMPVLVDFTATWCGPCKALAPALADIAGMYEGAVNVVKIDIDESTDLAQKYGVRSVPTLLLFSKGQVTPFPGMTSRSGIATFLDQAVEEGQ